MELISTELADILIHWESVKKDEEAFIKDLKGTGGAKLGKACTSLGADPPDTKDKAIATIIKKVKEIEANGGKLPDVEKPVTVFEEFEEIIETPIPAPEKKRRGRPAKIYDPIVVEPPEPIEAPSESQISPESEIAVPTGDDFKILLDESIEKLVPRADSRQYETIKHSIKMHGLKEKLICLPDGTLIDGYTRFKILGELGMPILPYMIEIRNIPEDIIKEEVFDINIARRHLPKTTEIEWAKRYMPVFKERKKPGPKPKTDNVQPDENNSGPAPVPNSETNQSKDTHSTLKKQAKAAGVGKEQLRQYNWCEKWVKDLLEEGKAKGEATETIYKEGQRRKKLIQKHGMWSEVEAGERSFMDAYETAKVLEASSPSLPSEDIAPTNAGPLEKEILLAKGWVITYFEKRYGFKWSEMPELLEDDANLLAKFDARAAKHRGHNQ